MTSFELVELQFEKRLGVLKAEIESTKYNPTQVRFTFFKYRGYKKDRNKKFFYTLRLKGDVKTDHKTDSNPLRTGQRII